ASQEKYTGDAFVDGTAAMAVVGPWAIATYKGKGDWGVVPVPTSSGKDPSEIHTFSDAKNVAMYSACKNRGTAGDVLKFATSKEQDGKFLAATGQMPLRKDVASTYADYFAKNPDYKTFADQASRTVEVPNVPNSITIWQTFRDAYSKSVIFGQEDTGSALDGAAQKVDQLAKQS
ncbi:extracellular solute-binding protein, partial [Kribbella soli]